MAVYHRPQMVELLRRDLQHIRPWNAYFAFPYLRMEETRQRDSQALRQNSFYRNKKKNTLRLKDETEEQERLRRKLGAACLEIDDLELEADEDVCSRSDRMCQDSNAKKFAACGHNPQDPEFWEAVQAAISAGDLRLLRETVVWLVPQLGYDAAELGALLDSFDETSSTNAKTLDQEGWALVWRLAMMKNQLPFDQIDQYQSSKKRLPSDWRDAILDQLI